MRDEQKPVQHLPQAAVTSAGFMEMDESSAEGAARETWEEAAAKIEVRLSVSRCTLRQPTKYGKLKCRGCSSTVDGHHN